MQVCCRCAGQGGDQMSDGWMPCYHCCTSGDCECPSDWKYAYDTTLDPISPDFDIRSWWY